MQYLKISNKGTVNRLLLEYIGLSTRRDNPGDTTVIGEKGSGSKLATIGALRLGLELTISSHDASGPYRLSFEQKEMDVDGRRFHEIYFVYSSPDAADPEKTVVTRKASSRMIESFQGWDQPIGDDDLKAFKAVREFICNAYDNDKSFVTGPAGISAQSAPGETAVYLKFTEDLKHILVHPSRYFKFMAPGVQLVFGAQGIGQIYRKSDPDKTRLFLLGVLADCSADKRRTSIFDYSLDKKSLLSEERILVDQNAYDHELGRLLGQLSDPTLCKIILANVELGKAPLEAHLMWYISDMSQASKAAWLEAARDLFGDKIAVADDGKDAAMINENAKQIHGYRLVAHNHYGPRRFLKYLGFPGAADVLRFGEFDIVPYGEFDRASQDRFMAAFRLFAINNPAAVKLPIYFFLPKDERMARLLGFAGIGDRAFKEMWIAAKSATELPPMRSLFETLMHEARHCRTGKGDIDRAFIDRADQEIAEIAFREDGHIAFGDEGLVPPRGSGLAKPVFGPIETRRQELRSAGITKIPEYRRK
ncbi:hypothetical protein HY633_02020 [Candidatus Uhrbacteria bacterium]|nr:hypothetical protein [Candidatus Uhrbacteria bacterium]